MTEFENLKISYTTAIQCALLSNDSYRNIKFANDYIHELCKIYIDNSNYADKDEMKHAFELLNEGLSQEIDAHFGK